MSYVEHGPRIFLAGGAGNETLTYGDCVFPKKRLEGRLKVYDSCADVRAWCTNPLENSRYFRELAENTPAVGKIVPFDVVIDNLIALSTQAQNELADCRRELAKYKALKLTIAQLKELQDNDSNETPVHDIPSNDESNSIAKRKNEEDNQYIQSSCQTFPLTKTLKKCVSTQYDNDMFGFDSKAMKEAAHEEVSQNESSYETNSNPDGENDSAAVTFSFDKLPATNRYCVKESYDAKEKKMDNNSFDKVKLSNPVDNLSISESYEVSVSGDEINSEISSTSSSDSETEDEIPNTIIRNEAEIIVLKNQLEVKEYELEDERVKKKDLQTALKMKEDHLNMLLQDFNQLQGMGDQQNHKLEDLRKEMYIRDRLIQRLKEDLRKEQLAHSNKAEELQFRWEENETIRKQNEYLRRKVEEMEKLAKEAEECDKALKKLRASLQELDDLRIKNQDLERQLHDQEEEIQKLVRLVEKSSQANEARQVKMRDALTDLKAEIERKNNKIVQCEKELAVMQLEVSGLTDKLNGGLNNMDEHETMGAVQQYKTELKDLIQDIKEVLIGLQSSKCQKQYLRTNQSEPSNGFDNERNHHRDGVDFKGEPSPSRIRKRMLAREDLGELERQWETCESVKNIVEESSVLSMNKKMDITSKSKEIIDRLNNALLDLDDWKFEKKRMECTIEQLNTEKAILSEAKGNKEGLEAVIVKKVSYSLQEIKNLMKKLKSYKNERETMYQQIVESKDDLRDAEEAANIQDDGVKILKQRVCEVQQKYKIQCTEYSRQIENLEFQLKETQKDTTHAEVAKLTEQLREALRKTSDDNKVDRALAIHVKKSIDKINYISAALKGAGDECTEIAREIVKQQDEIIVRNTEIDKLNLQIANFSKYANEHDEKIQRLELRLDEINKEVKSKKAEVSDLAQQLKRYKCRVGELNEHCTSLRNQVNDLTEQNIRLSTHCQKKDEVLEIKDGEIVMLLEKIQHTKSPSSDDINVLEKKINEMEQKSMPLRKMNENLTQLITDSTGILTERNQYIFKLLKQVDDYAREISFKESDYKEKIEAKNLEIELLKKTISSLEENYTTVQQEIEKLNNKDAIFKKETEKIDQIFNLQKEISKFNGSKRKLVEKLSKQKANQLEYENSNEKLERELKDMYEKNVELEHRLMNLKNVNKSDFLNVLKSDSVEKLESITSCTLYNEILSDKSQFDVPILQDSNINDRSGDNMSPRLQGSHWIYEQETRITETIRMSKNLKNELHQRVKELQHFKNKIRKMEEQKIYKSTCNISQQTESENDRKEDGILTDKLSSDTHIKSEIKILMEHVKSLTKEKEELTAELNATTMKYNSSLKSLQQKYDCIINSIVKKHNESIKRMTRDHDEIIKDFENPFDPDSWLKSLNQKEMVELHNRICSSASCFIADKNSTSSIKREQENLDDINEKHLLNRRISELENEILQKQQKVYELELIIQQEQRKSQKLAKAMVAEQEIILDLQKRLSIFSQNQFQHHSRDPSKIFHKTPNICEVDRDAPCEELFSNVQRTHNVGKISDLQRKTATIKDEIFDCQRKDFIHQCSIHHKYDYNSH